MKSRKKRSGVPIFGVDTKKLQVKSHTHSHSLPQIYIALYYPTIDLNNWGQQNTCNYIHT